MNKRRIANIWIGLLIIWIVIAVALLFLIQYAKVNVEAQSLVTVLVRIYIFSAFVVTGVRAWLKRKLSDYTGGQKD